MHKAWRRLARPFEATITWMACRVFGHLALVRLDPLSATCARCSTRLMP